MEPEPLTALQFVKFAGLSGVLGVLLTGVLLVIGVVALFATKRRGPFWGLLAGGVLVLGVGLLGTLWGYIGVWSTLATSPTPPTPAQLADGHRQAWASTVCVAPLAFTVWLVGIAGLILKPGAAPDAAKDPSPPASE